MWRRRSRGGIACNLTALYTPLDTNCKVIPKSHLRVGACICKFIYVHMYGCVHVSGLTATYSARMQSDLVLRVYGVTIATLRALGRMHSEVLHAAGQAGEQQSERTEGHEVGRWHDAGMI